MTKINSKILGIIILATIFGLASGMVGTLLTRVYVLEESFNLPLYGEINLSGSQYSGSSLIISNAKKVVVEQNTKVTETVKNSQASIVGIFEKKILTEESEATGINIDSFYRVDEKLGQGLIITSDGWIISNFTPRELNNVFLAKEETREELKDNFVSSYVVITSDNKVYDISDIALDETSSHSFWKVEEKDFPVKRFVLRNELKNGQLLLGVDWSGNVKLSSIMNINKVDSDIVESSDSFLEEIVLSEDDLEATLESFYFDLNGDLVALTSQDGKIIPIYSYVSCINCLLEEGAIRRASLGINYIDLSKMISASTPERAKGVLVSRNKQGIAVLKGSPADLAGIEEGDLIVSINGTILDEDNDLSFIVAGLKPDADVLIVYEREGERISTTLNLSEF